jgi:hypothetical protein
MRVHNLILTQWLYAILLSDNRPCLVVRCWTKQCFENCALLGYYTTRKRFSATSWRKREFNQSDVLWTISILIIMDPSFILLKYVQWNIIINYSWVVSIVFSAIIFQIHLMLCIEQICDSVLWVLWKSVSSLLFEYSGQKKILITTHMFNKTNLNNRSCPTNQYMFNFRIFMSIIHTKI